MNLRRKIEAKGLFSSEWKMDLGDDFQSFCLQITLPYDAQQLSKATRDTAALYLACGVDTSKV